MDESTTKDGIDTDGGPVKHLSVDEDYCLFFLTRFWCKLVLGTKSRDNDVLCGRS